MSVGRTRGRADQPVAPAKPRSDAYVGLLVIALLAQVVGIIFLYLDYSSYDGKTAPKPQPISIAPPAPTGPAGGMQGGPGAGMQGGGPGAGMQGGGPGAGVQGGGPGMRGGGPGAGMRGGGPGAGMQGGGPPVPPRRP